MAKTTQLTDEMLARIAAAEKADDAEAKAPPPVVVVPTPAAPTALATYDDDLATTLSREDIQMPQIRVAQGLSKVLKGGQVRLGEYYLHPEGVPLGQELDVILLNMFKTNMYFEVGQGLMCRSFDLRQGVGTPGIACAGCPMAEVPKNAEGQIIGASKCNTYYNYTALVIRSSQEFDEPPMAVLSFGRTAAPAGKLINSIKVTRTGLSGPWYPIWFRLRMKETENRKGTFYVPVPAFGGKVEGELLELAATMAESLSPASLRASIEADAEAA